MPAKKARFAARPPFGSSAVRVAVGTPQLSCREVRKAQKFTVSSQTIWGIPVNMSKNGGSICPRIK